MPDSVPSKMTLSGLYVSLRGVGRKSPYITDGLFMKSVQKQTVRHLTCWLSFVFFSKFRAKVSICGQKIGRKLVETGQHVERQAVEVSNKYYYDHVKSSFARQSRKRGEVDERNIQNSFLKSLGIHSRRVPRSKQ